MTKNIGILGKCQIKKYPNIRNYNLKAKYMILEIQDLNVKLNIIVFSKQN